jgi:hypothetical protein
MAEHEPCIGKTSEWFTPPEIFAALKLQFDLDPCSPGPGHWVPAKKVYTAEDDGLGQPWRGLTFVNLPFGGRNGTCRGCGSSSRTATAFCWCRLTRAPPGGTN